MWRPHDSRQPVVLSEPGGLSRVDVTCGRIHLYLGLARSIGSQHTKMASKIPPASPAGPTAPSVATPSLARRCLAEGLGTALLVGVGLSIVVFNFGKGSPVAAALPSLAGRRALTGFLFGATGMTIALSPIGKVSGAHINPIVSVAFWVERTLPLRAAAAYIASQIVGAVIGCVPLLLWGSMGSSVHFGATYPGPQGEAAAFAGEVATTFVLVVGLLAFVGSLTLRRFTPLIFPPMYSVMVWLEALYSGTSTNPARSFGPDVVGADFHAYWLYVTAPLVGTAVALLARRAVGTIADWEVNVARVAHFELGNLDGYVSSFEADLRRRSSRVFVRRQSAPARGLPAGEPVRVQTTEQRNISEERS